jgi:hypothetical protein
MRRKEKEWKTRWKRSPKNDDEGEREDVTT